MKPRTIDGVEVVVHNCNDMTEKEIRYYFAKVAEKDNQPLRKVIILVMKDGSGTVVLDYDTDQKHFMSVERMKY